MKKMLPESELARDERFVRIQDRGPHLRSPRRRRSPQRNTGPAKMATDRPAAAERSRSLMHGIFVGEIQALEGAGRTCFDFDDDRSAVPAQARHGPPVLGRVPPLRDLDQARRPHGHRDRRVHREHVPLRGRVQPRPGAAPLRREPRARGPRDRRVQHDEGVRQRVGRPGARVLRGLDARRRGDPREDGLRLAAPPHRQGPRAPRACARVPAHGRQRSSTSAASAARTKRTRSSSPAASVELAGFTDEENDSLAGARPRVDRAGPADGRDGDGGARRVRPQSSTLGREPRHRHARSVHARPVRRGRIAALVEDVGRAGRVPARRRDRPRRRRGAVRAADRAHDRRGRRPAVLWISGGNFEDTQRAAHVRRRPGPRSTSR